MLQDIVSQNEINMTFHIKSYAINTKEAITFKHSFKQFSVNKSCKQSYELSYELSYI